MNDTERIGREQRCCQQSHIARPVAVTQEFVHRFTQIYTDFRFGRATICENLCQSVDKVFLINPLRL